MKYILTIFIITLSYSSFSQVLLQDCPQLHTDRAYRRVEFFLTLSDRQEMRNESGTNDISNSEIQPVTDDNRCQQLYDIVQGNPIYKSINDNLSNKKALFLYRTNDFYFIFWDFKPLPDPGPGKVSNQLGLKTIFL